MITRKQTNERKRLNTVQLTWQNIQTAHNKGWTSPWRSGRTTPWQHLRSLDLSLPRTPPRAAPSGSPPASRTGCDGTSPPARRCVSASSQSGWGCRPGGQFSVQRLKPEWWPAEMTPGLLGRASTLPVSSAFCWSIRTSACNPWNKARPTETTRHGFSLPEIHRTFLTYRAWSILFIYRCWRDILLKLSILTGPVMAEFCNLGSSHCVVLVSGKHNIIYTLTMSILTTNEYPNGIK